MAAGLRGSENKRGIDLIRSIVRKSVLEGTGPLDSSPDPSSIPETDLSLTGKE